jgi:hypothetical protein
MFLVTIFSLTHLISAIQQHKIALPVPSDAISLNSTKGTEILQSERTYSAPFFKTFQHLTTQKTQSFCSIATSVTILNSAISGRAPIDVAYDPYPYWTQDNFFTPCTEEVVKSSTILQIGCTLDQLYTILTSCHNVTALMIKGNQLEVDEFRNIVQESLGDGKYIAVNFYRAEIAEIGGGHFSPILGYNSEYDLVLLTGKHIYPLLYICLSLLYYLCSFFNSIRAIL